MATVENLRHPTRPTALLGYNGGIIRYPLPIFSCVLLPSQGCGTYMLVEDLTVLLRDYG